MAPKRWSLVLSATMLLAACSSQSSTGGSQSKDCSQTHTGSICTMNHTQVMLYVFIDGKSGCVVVPDETCCVELDAHPTHKWEAKSEGTLWTEDPVFAPECDKYTIDVYPK